MSSHLENMQMRLKNSTAQVLVVVFKLFSGAFLGLTFALIGQGIIGYGPFAFLFVIVAIGLAFMKLAKGWSASQVLVFDLICVLIGLLLRMYILIAPGA